MNKVGKPTALNLQPLALLEEDGRVLLDALRRNDTPVR